MIFFLCAVLHLTFPRAIDPGPPDTRSMGDWVVFGITIGTVVVAWLCFLQFATRIRSMTNTEDAKVGEDAGELKVDEPLPPSTHTSDTASTGFNFRQRIKGLFHFRNPWKKKADVEWQTTKPPTFNPSPSGIIKLGQTCYINATIQCMNSLELFTNTGGWPTLSLKRCGRLIYQFVD